MIHSVEGYCLRTLTRDDVHLLNRYEQANRSHLQPWDP